MLARGCDVNVPWDRESVGAKTTLLMRSGPITQERLLRAGADPGLRDLRGRTAMHFVNFDDQVALLQQHGLDVNDLACPDDEDDVADRPLQYVLVGFTAEAPVEAVKALLAHGADPALPDGVGRNAWWYCSHVECAELLEPQLAFDPAMRDDKGGTVLHRAVHYSHRIDGSAIPLLGWWVRHGLDVNAQDFAGNTALHWMASFYDGAHDDESIRALVEQGARWDVVNAAGKTAREMLKKKFQKKVW